MDHLDSKNSIYMLKPSKEGRLDSLDVVHQGTKVFLAGTIDMGISEDWQHQFAYDLQEMIGPVHKTFTLFNPRRDDWDNSWGEGSPQLIAQIDWELKAMELADVIVMNILPDSKSPVTLLELGLHAHGTKLRIVCPKGFYKKTNVDVVCRRYRIKQFESTEDVIKHMLEK